MKLESNFWFYKKKKRKKEWMNELMKERKKERKKERNGRLDKWLVGQMTNFMFRLDK
jgi:hypothetical protein